MPYNTRRKSLSLESLGIHVPSSSRAAHRSPPTMTPVGEETTTTTQPPSKKVKRSHTLTSVSSTSSQQSSPHKRKSSIKILEERPKNRPSQHTPPPSPGNETGPIKIDIEGIDDDIVVGVIQQLEKTGNRPHLLKELAAILHGSLQAVQSSANPAAIISSRLATYLRRPLWTPLSPCPLAKTLIGTHPKRIYYFLTTQPAQPIPPLPTSLPALPTRRTPPLSSTSDSPDDEDDELSEEQDKERRARMSPSPDLDLTPLDFDGVSSQFSDSATQHPPTEGNMAHNRRAVSPPLETDEREFSRMVGELMMRRRSDSLEKKEEVQKTEAMDVDVQSSAPVEVEAETEESAARKNSEAAAALFGTSADSSAPARGINILSSPVMKPHSLPASSSSLSGGLRLTGLKRPLEDESSWTAAWDDDELRSPELVELEELDDMFGEY